MCACNLKIVGGIGSIWVLWLLRLLSLHHRGNWIKIIVFRIANPYNILRQISNLPQLRTSTTTGTIDEGEAGILVGFWYCIPLGFLAVNNLMQWNSVPF